MLSAATCVLVAVKKHFLRALRLRLRAGLRQSGRELFLSFPALTRYVALLRAGSATCWAIASRPANARDWIL